MFYIFGLFVIIGLILSGFTGSLPFDLNTAGITGILNNIFDDFKKKTYEFLFPKSENEILIDNLNSNYNLLDRFFSQSSHSILNSKDISRNDKEKFKQALEVFNKTKDQLKVLSLETVKNKPGILESFIRKTLDLDDTDKNINTDPDPTYIPPACRLECGE